ncbi:hypothetical protein [Flavobacterium soyae]|uniref:Barstar (Barnase inhibitor) n=1 Tax=Flavobacterium soyae TaxID=2903098 RepID=A0ABZ2UQ94_9FLAO
MNNKLKVEIFNKGILKSKCDYVFIDYYHDDDDNNEVYLLYLYNVKNIENWNLIKDESFIISSKLIRNNLEVEDISFLKITPLHNRNFGITNNIEIECTIDFDFYDESSLTAKEYNQDLIDLYFFWDQDKDFLKYRKNQLLYTRAALRYSGVPQYIPNDKHIVIDGNFISGIFDLYNNLAEQLLGNKTYIASTLDGLEDSLVVSNIDKNLNTNTIELLNHNILKKTLNVRLDDYFEIFIEILKNFGFNVVIKD